VTSRRIFTLKETETLRSSGLILSGCKTAVVLAQARSIEYTDWLKTTEKSYWEGGMSILTLEAKAQAVVVTDDALVVDLSDGRTISAPLAWYPRLLQASPEERSNWRFIGDRAGIHWPDLDEDISVENLLFGKHSGESQASFSRWLKTRAAAVIAN